VLWVERQPQQIDIAVGQHDLVDRRVARRNLDERLRIGEPPEISFVKLVLRHAKRGGQAPTVAGRLGDQLDAFWSSLIEQHRLRRRLDNRAEPGQRHRLIMHLDFAQVYQMLNKAAQPVLVGVDVGIGAGHAVCRLSRSRREDIDGRRARICSFRQARNQFDTAGATAEERAS